MNDSYNVNNNCLICGVGGQGVVLASRLIAACALSNGMFARTAETIGMAQRGGSVVSHVKWGNAGVLSPLITTASARTIIAFEPSEAVRVLPYAAHDCKMIVCDTPVQSSVAMLTNGAMTGETYTTYIMKEFPSAVILSGDSVAKRCGTVKVLNVALLGAAHKHIGFTKEDFELALRDKTRPNLIDINMKAFELGSEYAS